MFKEQIEYDNPKTLEEAMKKVNLCFDQNKNKRESIPSWKNNSPSNFEGMINNQPISILIDPHAILSNISSRVVDLCNLVPKNFDKSWLV